MMIQGSIVVAPEPLAAEVALEVFKNGGNAVDATVAVAFAQGVVNPQLCGIGGMGSMLVFDADREQTECIQFWGTVGSRGHPTMWEQDFLGQRRFAGRYEVRGNANALGYQSIVVPGFVRGMHEAWQRYGSRPWAELVDPSIRYAANGFTVYPYIDGFWRRKTVPPYTDGLTTLTATQACAAIYTKAGSLYDVGDHLVQREMAETLRQIAEGGADAFYAGPIADQMAADFAANGGLITKEDLENYQAKFYEPVVGTYRGLTITCDPPSSSGFQVIEMLNIVENFDLATLGFNSPETIRIMSEAMKIGFADKQTYLGDQEYVDVPLDRLLSEAYAEEQAGKIRAGEKFQVPLVGLHADQRVQTTTNGGTTHISVIDSHGNAVSVTHSICSSSGVVTPGLGFMYNNCMSQYCPVPDVTPNTIQPGRRRATGGCATIVFKEGSPFLILGSPGGNNIPTSVLQTIVNVVDHGMHIQEAVHAPRFHCEGAEIRLEATVPASTADAMREFGYEVTRSEYSYGNQFGRIQAILIDSSTRRPKAGADPRGGGGAVYSPAG